MLTNENYFDSNTINIFTDASLYKLDFVSYVCAGAIAIIGGNTKNIIHSLFQVSVGTNNYGEVTGLVLAVDMINQLKPYFPNATFNVFSDSKIALIGIRDWSNAWLNKSLNRPDRAFINAEGNLVANQTLYKKIMYKMAEYHLPVNFYHIKGHVNNNKDLQQALHLFKTSNGISLNKHVISSISHMNGIIDNLTRKKLHETDLRQLYPYPTLYSFLYPADVADIRTFRELKNYRGI